nr:MAG TPA: hypothetical protein [Caudoviricetes sp.]
MAETGHPRAGFSFLPAFSFRPGRTNRDVTHPGSYLLFLAVRKDGPAPGSLPAVWQEGCCGSVPPHGFKPRACRPRWQSRDSPSGSRLPAVPRRPDRDRVTLSTST